MNARERPRPIWHPVPVTELLMLGGLVCICVGMAGHGPTQILGGLVLLCLGVAELSLRDHVAGFRSHTAMLAFLGTVVVHVAVVLFLPVTLVGPSALALDLTAFAGLSWWLHRIYSATAGRQS
jgi:hypothetical protein